jgi:hypothetical protein
MDRGYILIYVKDVRTHETYKTFDDEQKAIDFGCSLRKDNIEVYVEVEIDYEHSRKCKLAKRASVQQQSRSEVCEEGWDGESDELHDEQSNNSVGASA